VIRASRIRTFFPGASMVLNIPVSNATIVLEDSGAGPPVLLLHGFPAARQLWAAVSPALVDLGFRVLVPDLVGYGALDAAQGVRVDMASQARWMLELLDVLGIERVLLVAHDVGSAAAQLMLVSAPERVAALVILDGVYCAQWAMEAIASIRTWNPSDAHRLQPLLLRRLCKTDAMRAVLAAYAGEQGGLRLIRAANDLDPTQTEHIGEKLRTKRVPALVLWGEHDRYLPVDTVARPLAELLNAPVQLLPGGHFTPADCPEAVVAALRDFLPRVS
jgi:2-hydroxymuconate-semialdehyde hydrolase